MSRSRAIAPRPEGERIRAAKSSEYFLFIDFKRERSMRTAVPRFLVLSSGVGDRVLSGYSSSGFPGGWSKRLDGMLGFLQGNCIPFGDRRMLARPGCGYAATQGLGIPDWKNCLILEREEHEFEDVIDIATT